MPPKRKTPKSSTRSDHLVWNSAMDNAVIDAFLRQHNMGNRVNGNFTTQAYDIISKEMKELFPDKPLDRDKIINRIKYIKKKFAPIWDLFKGGFNGFAWNRDTGKFDAEPNVWEQLIQQNSEAAEWRYKSFSLPYDKLSILYGGDRVAVGRAWTSYEMKESLRKEANVDTIEERDELIFENRVDLDGFFVNNQEIENGPTSAPVDEQSQISERASKKSKGKAKEGASMEFVKEAMDKIATAIISSAKDMVKEPLPIPEFEIVNLLDELGIKDHLHEQCYLFLVDNPSKLRALIRYPKERRKSLLMLMLSIAHPPSSSAN